MDNRGIIADMVVLPQEATADGVYVTILRRRLRGYSLSQWERE
jgi:hypothetical protein